MTLARSILGSAAVGALTSPHGVDRYLELVNPMWVVNDVRARIVDIGRETRAGEPVATLTLEPSSAWRGHEAGQYVQVGSRSTALAVPAASRSPRRSPGRVI